MFYCMRWWCNMKINKKKGVALLSVLILMTVIISFTGLFLALVKSLNFANKIEQNKTQKVATYYKIKQDFLDNQVIDEDYDYDIEIVEHDENIKAVVAIKKNSTDVSDMIYYCIYNFSTSKILAEQNKNFYLTIKQDGGDSYYYLADLVKYKEV